MKNASLSIGCLHFIFHSKKTLYFSFRLSLKLHRQRLQAPPPPNAMNPQRKGQLNPSLIKTFHLFSILESITSPMKDVDLTQRLVKTSTSNQSFISTRLAICRKGPAPESCRICIISPGVLMKEPSGECERFQIATVCLFPPPKCQETQSNETDL